MPRTLPLPKGNEKLWLDLLPSANERQHGRYVYMFRNSQTNQVVYTHYPKIEQSTLKQLPFIGKHSVPPRIRPDLWKAHCIVGPFPSTKQGRDALKKLRELRMLHQTNWKLTNPDWAKEPRKKLIKLIMNQRANSAADLARVLFIHRKLGHEMVALQRRRVREQHAYLKKKWPELRALAKTSDAMLAKIKQKIVDSTKLQKEATDEKERASAKGSLINAHRRLRKIQSAKKVVLRCDKSVSKFLAVKPKAAKPTKKTKEAEDEALAAVPEVERDLEPLPEPIPPLDQAIVEMVIPPTLKSIRGTPWTIKGVECKWADLVDPQYAAKWPQEIAGHQLLHKAHAKVMTEDEYNEREIEMKKEVQKETQAIYEKLKHEATQDERVKKGLPRLPFKEKSEPVKVVEEEKEEEQAKPTGLMRFVPGFIAKRFGGKKATAEA